MALSRVSTFDDPSACQAVFPSADVELFATAKGNFHAEVVQVGMNGLWMHRIHVLLPQINTVAIDPGRRSIGFLTDDNSSSLLDCGLEIQLGGYSSERHQQVRAHAPTEATRSPRD